MDIELHNRNDTALLRNTADKDGKDLDDGQARRH